MALKVSSLIQDVKIGEEVAYVTLGDHVWFFANNQTQSIPHVAVILRFAEDKMVDLAYYPITGTGVSAKLIHATGVCLVGSPLLDNKNNAKRGSWCPRQGWKVLDIKK